VFVDQEGPEEYGPVGLELREFKRTSRSVIVPLDPCLIEVFEAVTIEAPPRLREEFKVLCNGHDILVALPLRANLEVAEDVARDVGFERSLYQGTETLFGPLKIGVLRGDIEKPETLELPEACPSVLPEKVC